MLLDDVAERAADAVKFPYRERIARTKVVKRLGQAGSVGDGAAAGVRIQAITPGALQRITLQRQVLLGRGHPHVADQHHPTSSFVETKQSRACRPEMDARVCASQAAVIAGGGQSPSRLALNGGFVRPTEQASAGLDGGRPLMAQAALLAPDGVEQSPDLPG
jgi:hypothetical protein